MKQGGLPNSFRSAFEAALPEDHRQAFRDLAVGLSGNVVNGFNEDLTRQLFQELGAASAAAADDALGELAARVALNPNLLSRSISEAARPVLSMAGLNRFVWIVGVAAGGGNRSKRPLQRYFDACARWYVAQYCVDLLNDQDADLAGALKNNASHEATRRLLATDIRFRWISELILEAAAYEVEKDPVSFGALREVVAPAVRGFFEFYTQRSWSQILAQQPHGLSDAARDLARALSTPAGAMAENGFINLALSTEIERHPIVDFGRVLAPLGAREAVTHTEQGLFELARTRISDPAARSALFERVVSRVLEWVAPPNLGVLARPMAVSIPGTADPGELDFALLDTEQCLILGEAKAYFITTASQSVLHAFKDQVGKAVTQLDRRLDACRGGSPVTSRGREPIALGEREAIGLAVPLHSYATAIYNKATMAEVGGNRHDIAVLPIHQLILVMQSMLDTQDMLCYFELRARYRDAGVIVYDEADLLVPHLVGPHREQPYFEQYVAAATNDHSPILLPHYVEVSDALEMRRPGDRRQWRRDFMRLKRRNTDAQEIGQTFNAVSRRASEKARESEVGAQPLAK
jgi:hypothetical protein